MIEDITFTITLEYDQEENGNMPARNFLYHFLTRLDREFRIKELGYKGVTKEFTKGEEIKDIALREVDSIDEADRPEKPDMSEVTKLPEFKQPQI